MNSRTPRRAAGDASSPAATPIAHYDEHLGETYVWMCGGLDAALRAGSEELAAWGVPARPGDRVIDLGCGFGRHVLPLLAAGARVEAIDGSRAMLQVLRARLAPGAAVQVRCGDLADELARSTSPADAIICLGDTLTHLADVGSVEHLLGVCATRLAPHGRLALAFRDYSVWAVGERRRFDVRSDAQRRVECTVAVRPDHVEVEDRICEPGAGEAADRVRCYRKLRLAPDEVAAALRRLGLRVERRPDHAGMARLLAQAA